MKAYTDQGSIINDDNQLLAYGRAVYLSHTTTDFNQANTKMMNDAKN